MHVANKLLKVEQGASPNLSMIAYVLNPPRIPPLLLPF